MTAEDVGAGAGAEVDGTGAEEDGAGAGEDPLRAPAYKGGPGMA